MRLAMMVWLLAAPLATADGITWIKGLDRLRPLVRGADLKPILLLVLPRDGRLAQLQSLQHPRVVELSSRYHAVLVEPAGDPKGFSMMLMGGLGPFNNKFTLLEPAKLRGKLPAGKPKRAEAAAMFNDVKEATLAQHKTRLNGPALAAALTVGLGQHAQGLTAAGLALQKARRFHVARAHFVAALEYARQARVRARAPAWHLMQLDKDPAAKAEAARQAAAAAAALKAAEAKVEGDRNGAERALEQLIGTYPGTAEAKAAGEALARLPRR